MDINSKAIGAVLCILLVTSVFSGAAGKTKETDMELLRTTASLSGADSALLQDYPPGMVSYWKLDDSSGITVSDSYGGNSGEIQSNGNASDPQWAPGKVGNALYFAGDPSDSVEIDDDPSLHFGTGDFALEAWIKYEGPTDGPVHYPAIMSKRPGAPGSNPVEGFCLCLTYWTADIPGTLLLRIDGTNYTPCSTPVDDGEWHHIVAQRCRGQVQFYVDGQLDGTAQSNKNATTDAGLSLGLDPKSSFDTAWEGFLDEVAVYNCCLPSETIVLHYKDGLEGEGYWSEEEPYDCPPCMVNYWRLDDSSGITVSDSYGGNSGEIQSNGNASDPQWTTGKVGNALYFAGDPSDSVEIDDDPSLHFGTGDFALEAWIKYEGPTDGPVHYPAIMSKRPGAPGSNPVEGFCLCLTYWTADIPGTLLLRIDGTNYTPCSTPVDDGEWHHIVAQRCRGQVQFYVDGQLDGTAQSNKNATTDAKLSLGLDPKSSFDTAWEGFLDEVAIYNCCLPSETIALHYTYGLRGEGYCSEEEPCECGEWKEVLVMWADSDPNTTDEWIGKCGEVIGTVFNCRKNPITVKSSITCGPCSKKMNPHYTWKVTGPQGFVDQGNNLPAEFIPPYEGRYEVILNATCGNEKCEPCKITLGKVVFCEQDESPKATGTENGSCLGTVLLVAIIALGSLALQKRKD